MQTPGSVARLALGRVTRVPKVASTLRGLTLRGTIGRRVWIHLPVPPVDFEVPVGDSSFTYRFIETDPRLRTIYWAGLGGGESETFPVFRSLLKGATLFLDVGANTGLYSLIACTDNPDIEVIAVEAAPKVAELLVHELRLNGFEHRVELVPVAAGAESGTAEFLVPTIAVPTSSRLASAPPREGRVDRVNVEVRTVDEIVAGRHVDVIKIDVEGSESDVIAGASMTLANDRPAVIFELLPENPTAAITAAFAAADYRFFSLTARGPVPIEELRADSERHERNVLAMHRADPRLALVTT